MIHIPSAYKRLFPLHTINLIHMFWIKRKAKVGKFWKWFPFGITVGHPVDTQELGEAISQQCTVTPADVHAVLRALPSVMANYMESGRSVHMDGLGAFYYKLSCAGQGVDSPEEVGIQQVKSIRVQFIPARRKIAGIYERALIERVNLVEFSKTEDKKSRA